MRLNDLETKNYASTALKQNFEFNFDVSTLDKIKTQTMLNRVHGLIKESRQENNLNSPAYLKLVFMEQALSSHFNQLLRKPTPRIVFENEEVEKSQVVLAAQDLVDSVRKMIEQVSDMLVKELPALSDSIQSEIGVNESEQFTGQANEALTSLQAALTQSEQGLKSALNSITGQEGADFGGDMGMPTPTAGEEDGADLGMEMPDQEPGLTAETPPAPEEEEPTGSVGRSKR
jgi:hypothetical protein